MDNTILVVEDDPELQEILTLNLQNAGYRVMRAGTIRQAEQLLNSCRFAVEEGFIDNEYKLKENDTVIIIPPASGG